MTSRLLVAAAALLLLAGCTSPTAGQVKEDHREDAVRSALPLGSQLDPVPGELLGESVHDSCRTGQHNWKIDDPYDVICEVSVRRAHLVTGGDFREAAGKVTAAFPACPDPRAPGLAEQVLVDYWDALEGRPTRAFPGPYMPDHLPSYRLTCDPAAADQVAVLGWVSLPPAPGEVDRHRSAMLPGCSADAEREPCSESGDSFDEVLARAGDDPGWVVFLSASAEYART